MEKRVTPVVIGIIRNNEGKYLMTKRDDPDPEDKQYMGHWQFVGGGLEYGETVEDCLHRELKEELGVKVSIKTFIPRVLQEVRNGWHGLFILFLCEILKESPQIVLNAEASEFGWFTPDEIKHLKSLPQTNTMLELAESIK